METENTRADQIRYQDRMNQIKQTMFTKMENARTTGHINCDFMREMIPHHMGAVEMASLTLAYPICPELRPILQAIITSQQKGICQMQTLLQNLGYCSLRGQ